MPYFLQHVPRRAMGHGFIHDRITGELLEEAATLNCAHCQMIFRVQPGSGRRRGFCFKCNAVTCGKPRCERTCVPWEKFVERAESLQSLDAAIKQLHDL